MQRCYVGTTAQLARRLNQHNSGNGADETAPMQYRPWFVACYLTNMAHLDQSRRMSLEALWQHYNSADHQRGIGDVDSWIENGRRVMREHNTACDSGEDDHIRMVITFQRRRVANQNRLPTE